MHPIHIDFYLYIGMKRYLPLSKMTKDIIISGLSSETLQEIATQAQSDSKRQKLFECVLTGNSKLYLGNAYTEDQLKKLNDGGKTL